MAKQVLFVCTGNSCRSVMAQGLLQHQLKQLESKLPEAVEVSSAGIFAIEGLSPSRDTLALLQREGIDFSSHMARMLTDDMIRHSDLIFVMEQFHQDEILRRVPEAAGKVQVLSRAYRPEASPVEAIDIPDPIGKPGEVYESCFETIRQAVVRVADALAASQR